MKTSLNYGILLAGILVVCALTGSHGAGVKPPSTLEAAPQHGVAHHGPVMAPDFFTAFAHATR
jgi:hypothetical protein